MIQTGDERDTPHQGWKEEKDGGGAEKRILVVVGVEGWLLDDRIGK